MKQQGVELKVRGVVQGVAVMAATVYVIADMGPRLSDPR